MSTEDEAMRQRIAGVLVEGGDFTPALAVSYADRLLPLVKGMNAAAVRRFYLDAADVAVALGRRRSNAVADWLLDIGSDRVKELRK